MFGSEYKSKETYSVALFNSSDRMDVNGVDFAVADAVVSRVVAANEENWNVAVSALATFDNLAAKVRNDSIGQYGEDSARSANGITHDGKVYVIGGIQSIDVIVMPGLADRKKDGSEPASSATGQQPAFAAGQDSMSSPDGPNANGNSSRDGESVCRQE